jgi:heme/copper-type cytochrome/quinol oxidase subunit 2
MTRKTALINSVFVGSDSNANMIFRGDSPYGSSLYAIFSETGLQKQEQYNETIQSPAIIIPAIQSWWLNSLLIAAILIIIIIALALIIIYFRRRRKRKSGGYFLGVKYQSSP